MTKTRRLMPLGAALAALALFCAPAFAAGDGSSSTKSCPAGEVYDPGSSKCVKQSSMTVPDEALADYAYLLAREGRYQEALDTLDLMENPKTAEALNYRGYATRKLGYVDEGIGYYLQAVAMDPQYPLVRGYLGEAYILKGRLDLAQGQLDEVERICGTGCAPYVQLAAALQGRSNW